MARRPELFRDVGGHGHFRTGSRRRLRQIRLRGNWSNEAIYFVLSMLFILFVVVPWMACHPPTEADTVEGSHGLQVVR